MPTLYPPHTPTTDTELLDWIVTHLRHGGGLDVDYLITRGHFTWWGRSEPDKEPTWHRATSFREAVHLLAASRPFRRPCGGCGGQSPPPK